MKGIYKSGIILILILSITTLAIGYSAPTQVCGMETFLIPDETSIERYPELVLVTREVCHDTVSESENDNFISDLRGAITLRTTEDSKVLIDTDMVSAEEYYTESKVPIPNFNYVEMFDIDTISKKSTHYAVESVEGMERLKMEERIASLEGAVAQLSAELCVVNKNKYSWCN